MFKILMIMLARYDFNKGYAPRLKNAPYEREYGRQYAISAIFEHLSEVYRV